MDEIYPKDNTARQIGSRGTQIVHYSFKADKWVYHELTGNDYGVDAVLEYSNNGLFKNEKFECQIKATKNLAVLKNKKTISFSLEVKTLNYAVNSTIPFFLLVVDVNTEMIYFIKLEKKMKEKIGKNQKKVNVHIPMSNNLRDNESIIINAICK